MNEHHPRQIFDQTALNKSIIACVVIGGIPLLIVGIHAIFIRRIHWKACRLMQHVFVSDFIHLLLMCIYKYGDKDVLLFQTQKEICKLVYPIFTVTASDPNLAFMLTFTNYLYKSCKEKNVEWKQEGLSGKFLICWMVTFIFFTPQVFVEDLTQSLQTCLTMHLDLIVEMRIAYWIGMTYLQCIAFIIVFMLLISTRKALKKLINEAEKMSIRDYYNINGYFRPSKENGKSGKTSTQSCDCRRQSEKHISSDINEEISGSNIPLIKCEDVSAFQSFETSFSEIENSSSRNVRKEVKLTDVLNSRNPKAIADAIREFKYRNNLLKLLFLIAFLHLLSLTPQNVFFYIFHFQKTKSNASFFDLYQVTTVFTFINSVINPYIFLFGQKDLRRWCRKSFRKIFRFRESEIVLHRKPESAGKSNELQNSIFAKKNMTL